MGLRVTRHWPSQILIVGAAIAFVAIEATLAARHIDQDKRQTIEDAYTDGEALTLALQAHAGAVFESADAALKGVAAQLEQRGARALGDSAQLNALLAARAHGAAMLHSLLIFLPDGMPLASSNDAHRGLPNLQARESVSVHRAPQVRTGLHVAAPVKNSNGLWLLPLSRAWRDAEGNVQAVLVATVDLDGFRALYDARAVSDVGSSLGLVDAHGRQLVRIPFQEERMGERSRVGTQIVARNAQPAGHLEVWTSTDASRLYNYKWLPGYAVAAYVGQDRGEVLTAWRTRSSERIRTLGGLSALLLVFAFVAAVKVGRLARDEERLERAAHAASAGIWELKLRNWRMWRSRQWARLLGYEPNEIEATLDGFLSVVHPADYEFARTSMDALRTATGPVRVEFRVRRKDGAERWVECTAHVFGRRAGDPGYAVGSLRDITRRKGVELSMRESARMLVLAQRAAEAGVWSVDLKSGAARWSEGCYRLYGFSPVQAPPTIEAWQALVVEEDRERIGRMVRESIVRRVEFSMEYRIRHPEKGLRWLWTLGNTVPDEQGRPAQVAGITLDITERKDAEEERQILLASERKARAEAERASRAKEEFLATVSHELRTPLNAILGWAHVLRTRDKEPDLVLRSVESIERSALAQAQLIADLLDISRIESGTLRLDLEVVDLKAIIDAACNTILPTAEAKGVRLAWETDSFDVRADPARLQQVMWNLLSNAVKFTPKGGVIKVQTRDAGEMVEIKVCDTGIGIPRDFQPMLFQRFSQSRRSAHQSFGGLGLGLAIVKHLVQAHGGEVQLQSEGEGKGAVATLRLPMVAARLRVAEPPPESPYVPVALNGVRVLLVEDSVDSREIAALILSSYGAVVVAVTSVDEALAALDAQLPDLIVADLSMPQRDGFELMRTVRSAADARLRHVPAIALSALASAEDRARAIAAGFNLHLSKPVEPQLLLDAVARLAARSATRPDGTASARYTAA